MTISKAIEILDLNIKEAGKKMPPDCKDALQLGIQALQRVQFNRASKGAILIGLLTGETDEHTL